MYKYLEILSISILLTNIYLLISIFNKKTYNKIFFELVILLSIVSSKLIITAIKDKYILIYNILSIGVYIYILVRLTKKYIKYPYKNDIDIYNEIIKINLYKRDIDNTLDERKFINDKLSNIKFRKEKIIDSLLRDLNKGIFLVDELDNVYIEDNISNYIWSYNENTSLECFCKNNIKDNITFINSVNQCRNTSKILSIEIEDLKNRTFKCTFAHDKLNNNVICIITNRISKENDNLMIDDSLFYEKIVSMIPNAVFIQDFDSKEIKYANESFIKLIGNMDLKFINNINIDTNIYKDIIDFKRETIINENGEKINIEVGGLLLDIDKKRILIGIIKDITEQTKRELVDNKIKENEMLNKSKTEFFINMSHELKTPLNLIHASNQLMDSVYSKQLKENNNLDILNDVKIIKKQVNILSTLIDNIIELSKLHHNSHEIKKDNYNIVEILDEIVEQFNKFIEKDNINIIFDPDEEEKIVNIDADDIEKVIIILLSLVTRYSNNNSSINFKVKTKKDFIIINIENSSGYNYDNYLIDSEKSVLDMGVKLAKEIIGLYDGKLNISEGDRSIHIAVKIKNICKTKNYKIRVRNNNEEFIHSQYKKMCNF